MTGQSALPSLLAVVDGLEKACLSPRLVQIDAVSLKIVTVLSEELINGSITSSQP